MGKRLYVGNLSYALKSQDLEELFRQVGDVVSVKVVTDMETGRSKGFGFVEMASDELGAQAIETLNGKEVGGRALRVTEANPRPERPSGGGFRSQGGGGRGGFGGGNRGGFGGGNRGNNYDE
jgi:RNA recognition motif-containing protein